MDRQREPQPSTSSQSGIREILSHAMAQLDRIESPQAISQTPARAATGSNTLPSLAQARTVSPQIQSAERLRLFRQFRPMPVSQYTQPGKALRPARKRARVAKWRHEFVCLADKEQDFPPNPIQRAHLLQAGLGSKVLSFLDVDDPDIFHQDLLEAYPKLIEGGGYELLRTGERGNRFLDVIPVPSNGYNVLYLKSIASQAKVYIRPLQQSLSLEPICDKVESCPMEDCMSCGKSFPLSSLKDHIKNCEMQDSSVADEQLTLSSPESPHFPSFNRSLLQNKASSPLTPDRSPYHSPQQPASPIDLTTTEDEMLVTAIAESVAESSVKDNQCFDLKDVIKRLRRQHQIDDRLLLEFRRDHVLDDALSHAKKKKFHPSKQLKVIFVGEEGEDTGGLRREFWRLFALQAVDQYCIGDAHKTFLQNVPALQMNVFKDLGRWVAMSIIQDGFGFPYFSPALYEYMICGDATIAIVDEQIPDPGIRAIVSEIRAARDELSMQQVFENDDYCGLLLESGYRKTVKLDNTNEIIATLTSWHTLVKIKAELDQFLEGLECLGIHTYIKRYPELMRDFFVLNVNKNQLTADFIKEFLRVSFSDKDSDIRAIEEQAYMHFVNFLDDCEEGKGQVQLKEILTFFTGADRVPPTGFPFKGTLEFIHDHTRKLATASTCDIRLRLPTCHTSYCTFTDSMTLSFCGHGGFGLV